MTTPLQLATQDIQFGPKYDPRDLNRMMQQLNAVTRFSQKFLMMLRAGEPGQVLTKKEHQDLIAEWANATGGGDCCIPLEPEQVAMGGPDDTTVPLSFGTGLDVVDGVLINTGVPGPQGDPGDDGSPGAPGVGFAGMPGIDGDQGDDGFPIPGGRGETGAPGISIVTQILIPGFDGHDGEDALPIPGPAGGAGVAGATGASAALVPGWDGEDGAEGMPIPGNTGATGGVGPAGLTIPGWDGEDGADGMPIPGPSGPAGAAGAAGGGMGPPGMDGMDSSEIDWVGFPKPTIEIGDVHLLSSALTLLDVEVNTKQDMIEFQDEGVPLGGPGDFISVNFTGGGVRLSQPVFGNLVVEIPTQNGAVSILEDNSSDDGFPVPGPQGIQGIPGGGGGGGSATTVETNVGSTPIAGGRFTITDAAITATSKVIVTQAPGAYTGKGTRGDEAEMDPIICVAVPATGSAIVYWRSVAGYAPTQEFEGGFRANTAVLATGSDYIGRDRPYRMRTIGRVKGNIKFTYQVFT